MKNLEELFIYLKALADQNHGYIQLAFDNDYPEELNKYIFRIPGEMVTIYVGTSGITLHTNLLTMDGTCADTTWPIEGLATAKMNMERISIILTETVPKENALTLTVSSSAYGKMKIGQQANAPVMLAYQASAEGNPWKLALSDDTSLSATDIISTSFNFPIPFTIPQSINFMDSIFVVGPDSYQVLFYPNTKYPPDTTFTIHCPLSWEPVKDILTFKSVDIRGALTSNAFGATIIGHLGISGLALDLGIYMSGQYFWKVFITPTPPATSFPGLAALAGWIGGSKLQNDVSNGFSSVEISPEGFDLAISYMDASVDLYGCSFQSLNIKSILRIGAMAFDVKLSLPSITINGNLHDNKPLKVCALLESLSLPTDAVPEKLEVAAADFKAALRDSNYSIFTEVNNLWQAGPFSFEKIKLYLAYDSFNGLKGTFTSRFSFKVDSATDIIIGLEAQYGIEERGWVFHGGIPAGETLKLGDIIAMLASQFGIKSIPEPIKSLVLTSFSISYSATNHRFIFECLGTLRVDDVDIEMAVDIIVSDRTKSTPVLDSVPGNDSWCATFAGRISINKLNFNIKFDTVHWTRNVFIASYDNSSKANASKNKEQVPLHDLVAGVSTTLASVLPAHLVIDLKEVKFVYYAETSKKQFMFGLEFDVVFDLRDLPVVGDKVPEGLTMEIRNTQVLFASELFTSEQTKVVNALLPDSILPLPYTEQHKGLMISGELKILSLQIQIDTGKKEKEIPPIINKVVSADPFIAVADTNANKFMAPSEITWFNVQKQLGPLAFERIGVAYENNVLSFALDASIVLGPAGLSMMGLNVGSPLSHFEPVFGLQGFAVGLKTSGLELGGAFLKAVEKEVTSYFGMVTVSAGGFGFKAMGGHTPSHETKDPSGKTILIPTSFFIYTHMEIPLGGPPCFSLNALAGGFGINNRLKLPTIDQLADYILLPGPGSKAPKQGDSPRSTIKSVLPQMQAYFISEQGQYWMAAGIGFSSFQMINGFALVTVSLGVDFQIGLLGSVSMTFPKGIPKPLAYIEIVMIASFSQSTGLLAVEGVVSPASYIFGDFCRLTGSFAFYIWICPPSVAGGPKAGDFLVSMGGYHPGFKAPSYYPKLPRIGLNFNLLPLQVAGEAYFAITPGMFMAGARMKATYRLVAIKAWFELGIDFIIAWAPLKYDAVAYIRVGCSVNLGVFTINASIGAHLTVWGPPFGGKATVDLEVISFDIAFGDQQQLPPPALTWNEFKSQFLPADTVPSNLNDRANAPSTNIIKGTVSKGLNNTDFEELNWIIDPDGFIIQVNTAIPANHLEITTGKGLMKELPCDTSLYNIWPPPVEKAKMPYMVFEDMPAAYHKDQLWNPDVNMKPMARNQVKSSLTISLTIMNSTGGYSEYITDLTICPIVEDSPGALWEKNNGSGAQIGDPAFLHATLNGFKITPIPRVPSVVNNVPLLTLLYTQHNDYWFNYKRLEVDSSYQVSSEGEDTAELRIHVSGAHRCDLHNKNYVLSSIADQWVTGQRDAILKNLVETGFDVYSKADLSVFSTQTALTDWPEILKLADYFQEQ